MNSTSPLPANPPTRTLHPPAPVGPPAFHFRSVRQPMLWAALAYSSGIVAGFYQWRPTAWWAIAAAIFALAAAYFACRRPALGWTLALGALFLAGALHIQTRENSTRLDTTIQ